PGGAPPGHGPVYVPRGHEPPAAQPPGMPVYRPEEITSFDDGAPVPYGYTAVTRARVGLIVGGGVTFGATYVTTVFGGLLTAAFGTFVGRNTDVAPFFIPVFGPFVEIGHVD